VFVVNFWEHCRGKRNCFYPRTQSGWSKKSIDKISTRGIAITLMCKLISYSYSVTRERVLVPIDWDVGWTPRAVVEVLGILTIESEELVFLVFITVSSLHVGTTHPR
jgi:hypothetical protein